MKTKYSIVLFVIIWLSCSQTKYIGSIDKNAEQNTLYKIKKIVDYGLFDVIYAQKNDSLFKIISLSDTIISNLKPLEVGEKYSLDLMRIYPNPIIQKTVQDAKIGAIDSCFMSIEKKAHNNLYFAVNLNGLFLSENNRDTTEIMNKFSIYTIFCDACKNNKFLLRLYLK